MLLCQSRVLASSFFRRALVPVSIPAMALRHPPTASQRRTGSVEALAPAATTLHRPAANAGISLRFGRQHLSLPLPSEMWGAASLALQLTKTGAGTGLTRVASAWSQPLSSFAAPPPPPPRPSGDEPKSITEALEYQPALSAAEDVLSLLGPACLCAAVYCLTAPAAFQLRYAAAMALLYAGLVAGARGWLLERKYQAVQRSERELAGPDSKFLPVEGIAVHYKARRPRPQPGAPAQQDQHQQQQQQGQGQGQQQGQRLAVHCLHGFGASAYSWSFVQDELAGALGAVVTAHDMPGFGLTQRPAAPRFYTLGFNGAAARAIMDAEVSAQRAQRVLVGHSMGGAAVAEGIINHPEGIDAVVLVAPAIVALWAGPPQQAQRDSMATGLAVVGAQDAPDELEVSGSSSSSLDSMDAPPAGAGAGSNSPGAARSGAAAGQQQGAKPHSRHHRVRHRGPRALRVMAAVVQASALVVVRFVLRLAAPLLVLLLRRLVRDVRFWQRGLTSAWVDKSRIGREYVDAYRSGQLVRGWEWGILNFLSGRFAEKQSFVDTLHHVLRGDGHLSQAERLARVVEQHGIHVLIVHGSDDILVPAANSRRLASLLPGARLVEFKRCGHMPHEEMPERFVAEVAAFLAEGEGGSNGGQGGGDGADSS